MIVCPRLRSLALLAAAAAAASLASASPLAAQYPLAPSAVLPTDSAPHDPRLGGYLSLRETLRNDSSDIAVNRARLTAIAQPLAFVVLKVQAELSSSASARVNGDSSVHGFALTDAYVQIAPPKGDPRWRDVHPALIAGQFKQPFSLEYNTPFAALLTASRSFAVDRLSPKRDIGIMAQASLRHVARIDAALTNGEGANAIANDAGRQLAMGRITLFPLRGLALGAKIAGEGADHARGWDGRWLWRGLAVEGETIHRSRPTGAGASIDAGGGYAAIAYHVLPWLQPVYKREWYTETITRPAGVSDAWRGVSTFGVNMDMHGGVVRLLLDWVVRTERPTPVRDNEIDAQLVAAF